MHPALAVNINNTRISRSNNQLTFHRLADKQEPPLVAVSGLVHNLAIVKPGAELPNSFLKPNRAGIIFRTPNIHWLMKQKLAIGR
jgi:hypothetical protein